MNLKKVIPRLIIVVIVVFILASKIGGDKPLKNLNYENIDEIQLVSFSNNNGVNLDDETDIKKITRIIKKIHTTRETNKNINASNLYYIKVFLDDGSKIEVIDSDPYLSIDGKWYEVDKKIFTDLRGLYKTYLNK
ncbi:MAG: hypothetical protein GXZ08_07950 [Tissierellia bacterium]|nr:hypothetical protein [Tissierellia bacterium]